MERMRTSVDPVGGNPPGRPSVKGPSMSSKILVIVLVLVGLVVIAAMFFGLSNRVGGSGNVKEDQYQAVFLTNGQVYFGKLSNLGNEYVMLEDIYYLQVTETAEGELQQGDNANVDPQISLAQLGNELHGPEKEMFINNDQILFWENLRNDGDVVTAISNFASGQGATNDANGQGATVPAGQDAQQQGATQQQNLGN